MLLLFVVGCGGGGGGGSGVGEQWSFLLNCVCFLACMFVHPFFCAPLWTYAMMSSLVFSLQDLSLKLHEVKIKEQQQQQPALFSSADVKALFAVHTPVRKATAGAV